MHSMQAVWHAALQDLIHLLEDLLHELLQAHDIHGVHFHVLVITVLSPQRCDRIERSSMQGVPSRNVHNIILHTL